MSDFAVSNLPTTMQVASATTEIVEVTSEEVAEVKVDLRQALSFVIDEDSSSAQHSEEELAALEQRRLDLIMWLLNLELRLTPYCTDFA